MLNPTETVLHSHLQAAGIGVDAVMADYGDASVIITHESTYRGLSEIREFFTELLEGASQGFIGALKMTRQEVIGEVAFIHWDAPPWFHHGTDTFVIRNGKILVQTFSAYRPHG
jgi:hypothetical protein